MIRHRRWARIPSTIVVSTALLFVTGSLLNGLGRVSAGGFGGANAPAKSGLGKVPEPPSFGIAEEDDTVLLADKPGKLNNVTPATKVIALDLTYAEVRNSGNEEKLSQWVQRGGIVWAHTDAAQAFGFRTAPLRNVLELNGRAVTAGPWNSHFLMKGVQRVYYTLRQNSSYVASNPRALMLLRNVDNPSQPGQQFFVAAYLPLGKGAVIFFPPQIHKRADGNAFGTAIKSSSTGQAPVVEVPIGQVEAVANLAANFARDRAALAAAQAYVALWQAMAFARAKDKERAIVAADRVAQLPGANADVMRATAEVYTDLGEREQAAPLLRKAGPADKADAGGLGLMLSVDELDQAAIVFGGGGAASGEGKAVTPAAPANPNAAAALARVWLGRLYYQLGSNEANLQRADQQFQAALKLDEASPAANAFEAYLLASAGRKARSPSFRRAELLNQAAQLLAKSQPAGNDSSTTTTSPATVNDPGKGKGKAPDAGKGKTPTTPPPTRSSGPAEQLRREAEVAAAEPPLARIEGNIIIRSFQGDAAATAYQAVLYSKRAAEQLGFYLDEIEILSFPTQAQYVRYLRLVEAPRGEFDVIAEAFDNKVITHLQATGGGVAVGKYGGGRTGMLTPIFGHIFGHALMYSLAEGGTLIPGWLREGLAAFIEPQRPDPLPILRAAQQQRAMLRVEDLSAPFDLSATDENRRLVYQCQSHSIVQHLSRVGGQGVLVRLVQELGAGKDADAALQSLIGGSFDDLYNDWARKVMGVR